MPDNTPGGGIYGPARTSGKPTLPFGLTPRDDEAIVLHFQVPDCPSDQLLAISIQLSKALENTKIEGRRVQVLVSREGTKMTETQLSALATNLLPSICRLLQIPVPGER